MSVIQAVRTYLATYSGLKANAPLWVDYLGSNPTQYAVVPLAGGKIVESYIDGSSLREFPFAFQSMERTADDLERLENNGFFEAFSDWLESQSNAGIFPVLGAGKTPELIEALGWGYLYEQGESDSGIYQVQCRLVYQQN
jgi:hypothetical protein